MMDFNYLGYTTLSLNKYLSHERFRDIHLCSNTRLIPGVAPDKEKMKILLQSKSKPSTTSRWTKNSATNLLKNIRNYSNFVYFPKKWNEDLHKSAKKIKTKQIQ